MFLLIRCTNTLNLHYTFHCTNTYMDIALYIALPLTLNFTYKNRSRSKSPKFHNDDFFLFWMCRVRPCIPYVLKVYKKRSRSKSPKFHNDYFFYFECVERTPAYHSYLRFTRSDHGASLRNSITTIFSILNVASEPLHTIRP